MWRNKLSLVVPAQAGTHTPQQSDVVGADDKPQRLVVMGPRLRGDDSDWVCAKTSWFPAFSAEGSLYGSLS